MLMDKFRAKIFGYKVDPDELQAMRTAVPSHIRVDINKDKLTGHYSARILELENHVVNDLLVTEAPNADELIVMLNDLILGYRNVPEVYRPYFTRLLNIQHPDVLKDLKNSRSLTLVKN